MIAVLSLAVAILAVFLGPVVAWAIAQRQIAIAARETWLREFREKVAALLSAYDSFVIHAAKHTSGNVEDERRLTELNDKQRLPYHAILLLIYENGEKEYSDLISNMEKLLQSRTNEVRENKEKFFKSSISILKKEGDYISKDPGIWHSVFKVFRFGLSCHR